VSSAPAVLAVDPAAATGLAMLLPDGSVWCHTLKLRKVPPDAQELALLLADLAPRMPWGAAPEWHLVVERMYVGTNNATSVQSAETAGMLLQELGRMRAFASVVRPFAVQWRSILWQGAGRLTREMAKVAAVDLVERTWPALKGEVGEDAAEAACMALWRVRELEHEATRMRLGIELPRKGKARKRKPGAGKRGRPTEAEVLALKADREDGRE